MRDWRISEYLWGPFLYSKPNSCHSLNTRRLPPDFWYNIINRCLTDYIILYNILQLKNIGTTQFRYFWPCWKCINAITVNIWRKVNIFKFNFQWTRILFSSISRQDMEVFLTNINLLSSLIEGLCVFFLSIAIWTSAVFFNHRVHLFLSLIFVPIVFFSFSLTMFYLYEKKLTVLSVKPIKIILNESVLLLWYWQVNPFM